MSQVQQKHQHMTEPYFTIELHKKQYGREINADLTHLQPAALTEEQQTGPFQSVCKRDN
jgi:hypothetical protein